MPILRDALRLLLDLDVGGFELRDRIVNATGDPVDLEVDDRAGRNGFAFEQDQVYARAAEQFGHARNVVGQRQPKDVAVKALRLLEVGAAQANLVDGGECESGVHRGHGFSCVVEVGVVKRCVSAGQLV